MTEEKLSSDLVPTGIQGLDEILLGGLPAGKMYLLSGSPGAGKTTFSLQFIAEGIKRGDGLVFAVEGSKKPVNIRKAWLKVRAESEISDFRFHDLRHTAASYLAMNGATTLEIAEILGHKTLAMVKRYAHLSAPHTRGVIESLVGKLFDGKSEEGGDEPVVKDGAVLYRTAA
jgi:KaiC/GvpD/RAD55 family RecA-like ATPase